MNKSDLSKKVAADLGLTQVESARILNHLFDEIVSQVQAGEKVTIQGFGSFALKERAARMAVKPGTTEKIQVPAKKVVKFSAGSDLKL